MRVQALKIENGFLIPLIGEFKRIKQDRVLLEVEIVDQNIVEVDYSAIDQLVGLCETGKTDASVNHDRIIYGSRGMMIFVLRWKESHFAQNEMP